MSFTTEVNHLFSQHVKDGDHVRSDYLTLIKGIVERKGLEGEVWQKPLDRAYALLLDEIKNNSQKPGQEISFGTSGWRGRLGKDIYVRSVAGVTSAIVEMYQAVEKEPELALLLGVSSCEEAKKRGCVLGFDSRFAGELLAATVAGVLTEAGFVVHYAGESTTGVLSAAVLERKAAFSINLTPSHNPLEYGGYKFNAADAGPAASGITERITRNARRIASVFSADNFKETTACTSVENLNLVEKFDSLAAWKSLVAKGKSLHGLDLDGAVSDFLQRNDIVVAIDCVHGASRLHVRPLFGNTESNRLIIMRDEADVTFGGVAPEPSAQNMRGVVDLLQERKERLKLGAIIDPDGDRIRFTDGTTEISMNQFGAMAYHFLHEYKQKRGLVAKTVATSNLANSLASAFGEKLFEPAVGFKNFKPVIGEALVYFEESDGISVAGHTPEKDAYIGLLLALEMLLTTDMNLGDYLRKIEDQYGAYYPDRDGVEVSVKGPALLKMLDGLQSYSAGKTLQVGKAQCTIKEVITIDGRKMILEDGSWLMIRPSGTEPKVRFYVESRNQAGTKELVEVAKKLLKEVGIQ